MQKISRPTELFHLDFSELSSEYLKLSEKAREALSQSYSPYSQFPVGAALLFEDGEILLGSNQENAAYPSGLCAERTVLFYAGSNFPDKKIKAIAVAVGKASDNFPFPCGGCLQALSEYEHKQTSPMDVLLVHPTKDEILQSAGLKNLLPFAFDKSQLGM